MENKVADGAIGMRLSAILRRPSIFKSSSLAKRAGGRRVFLSRRKITHCPLSVVPRPSPTSCLPPAAVASLVRLSRSPSRNLSLSLFGGSLVRPRQVRPVSSFILRAISGAWAKIWVVEKLPLKKKKKKKMRDAKCYHSSVILRNYIAQDMLLTRIYKDVITRVRYEHIKNKSFLFDARQMAYKLRSFILFEKI